MNRSAIAALCLAIVACSDPPSVAGREDSKSEKREVVIVIDSDTALGKVYNFWNVSPVTVQAPFKDQRQHPQLRRTLPFAKTINCVRFLGGIKLEKDDYFRGVDADGQAICDFREARALLAGVRKCGFTPWIVLDNVPAAMSEEPARNRYGNTEPPADYQVWSSYVRQLVRALVDEFGGDEVSRWRFRVGTEPDLSPGHWSGTKDQYFEHYDHTAAAVRSILPQARIGPGNIIDPAKKRKWRSWGLEIIDHCGAGTNHATGEIGAPMDFFGSSYYTAVGLSDERFDTLVDMIRQKLSQYPQLADVPVEIHEFGILSEGGKWIVGDGTEWGGSWMAHMADKIYRNRVPRVFQWAWNTTKAGGVPIPLTHVLGMLEEMSGGTRLSAQASPKGELDDVGCVAGRKDGVIDLIVYRHLSVRDDGEPVRVQVVLQGEHVRSKDWSVIQSGVINREHSGFIREQKRDVEKATAEAADDADPFAVALGVMAAHREKYLRMSELNRLETPPRLLVDDSGDVRFELQLEGHSVVHLRLE